MMALSRADSVSSARKSSSRAHLVRIERRRQALFRSWARARPRAGFARACALAQQELVKRAHRREPPLDAARGRGRRACPVAAKVRTCAAVERRSSARSCARRRRRRAARYRRGRRRPCERSCAARASDARRSARSIALSFGCTAGPRPQRVKAFASSSPMRVRNSVLMAGWNRSASLAPIARRPSAPLGRAARARPSRSRWNPCRRDKSRCASRICPQRGLPDCRSDSNVLIYGIGGIRRS